MAKNSPKRALVTSNTHLTDTDGKSLRVLGLAELLNATGFETTIIVSDCNSVKARKFSVIETKTHLRNTFSDSLAKKMFHFGRQFIKLLSFYTKFLVLGVNCDIVASTLVGPEIDSLFACILSKVRRVPFIYDYDDPSPEIRMQMYKGINDPRTKLSLISRNILIRNASLVLTAAETVRLQIADNFKKTKRVSVWYNSPRAEDLNISTDKIRLRQKLELNMDAFVVSYLGNIPNWAIEPLKNMLINCAENPELDEKVLFLIIGGGIWEDYYRSSFEKSRLSDRIVITGRKARNIALEYLMASDVSCIPFEPSPALSHVAPTKLFEAMALGIPVLCMRSPNFVRILDEDGVYFDGSPLDLMKKIRWCLMNEEKLNKISSDLKSKFFHEYSWEKRHLFMENTLKKFLSHSEKTAKENL